MGTNDVLQVIPSPFSKVAPGSLSDQAGLQVGDVIARIGNTETASLLHKEAQDAIIGAGNYLELHLER